MKRELLTELPFFPYLTEEQKRDFQKSAEHIRCRAGEVILSPEQAECGMIRVLSGSIRTSMVSDTGKRVPLFHLREGQMCVPSNSCAFSAFNAELEATAEQASELLVIPAEVYSRAERENVYVQNFSYRMLADRLMDLSQAMQQMMFLSLEQRLVGYLLEESRRQDSAVLQITQEEAAENIGSAREAVSRSLKKLKEKGLISAERGRVELLDKKRLYELTLNGSGKKEER